MLRGNWKSIQSVKRYFREYNPDLHHFAHFTPDYGRVYATRAIAEPTKKSGKYLDCSHYFWNVPSFYI